MELRGFQPRPGQASVRPRFLYAPSASWGSSWDEPGTYRDRGSVLTLAEAVRSQEGVPGIPRRKLAGVHGRAEGRPARPRRVAAQAQSRDGQPQGRQRPQEAHLERFRRRIEDALASVGQLRKDDTALALELAKVRKDLDRGGSEAELEAFREAVRERHYEIRLKGSRDVFAGEDEEGSPTFVEREHPEQIVKADAFSDIALGRATPVDIRFEDYHAQLFVKARTKADDLRRCGT